MVSTALIDGEYRVAAYVPRHQRAYQLGCLAPALDAADLGVQAAGGDEPDQRGKVLAVRDVAVHVAELAQRRARAATPVEEVHRGRCPARLAEPQEQPARVQPRESG